jgi:hypothetical protein
LRKLIGVGAGLMLLPYVGFTVLLFFLWMFWENLGNLTLSVYDDYQLSKAEKARKGEPDRQRGAVLLTHADHMARG